MLFALLLLSAAVIVLGICVGSTGWEWPFAQLSAEPVTAEQQAGLQTILWEVRLPRTLGAWLAGALLGVAGAVAQGLFRNPLADPYLLGSAPGASLGVAIALAATSGSPFAIGMVERLGVTGAAFIGATLAVLLTLSLARGVQHTLRLLLAGVVSGVVLSALGSLVLLARPDILQAMQSFMLGSTSFIGWDACLIMGGVLLFGLVAAWMLARALDALALGEWTARTLGLPLGWMRAGLVGVLALATGAAVAQTGLIAFVGLAAPHLVRGMVQVRHGMLVILSACMGGILLTAADVLARWVMAPQELPTGILTAVLGGTYLLWLMHRQPSGGST
ncbi:MAG: iron ABC transporter permease [Brachymonas denitrificans]